MYYGHTVANIHRIAEKKEELKELYASIITRSLAFSLIGLFIPVYLLSLGFPLGDVILFEIMTALVTLVISPFVASLTSKIGVKHTMLLSFPIALLFLATFLFVKDFSIPLIVVALFRGLTVPLYWIPLNSDFAKSGLKKEIGKEAGYYALFPKIAGVIGPVAGGVIASMLGFASLFLVVGAILLVSVIFPLLSSDYKSTIVYKWENLAKHRGSMLDSLIVEGMLMGSAALIFPLFIYQHTENVMALGELGSALYLGTFLFTILAGKLADAIDKKVLIRIGGLILSVGWTLLFFSDTAIYLALSSIVLGMGAAFVTVGLFAKVVASLRTGARMEMMALREMALRVGMIIIYLAFFFAPPEMKYSVGFGVSILASAFFIFRGV